MRLAVRIECVKQKEVEVKWHCFTDCSRRSRPNERELRSRPHPHPRNSHTEHNGPDCPCGEAARSGPASEHRPEACRCVACSSPEPPCAGNRCSPAARAGVTWAGSPGRMVAAVGRGPQSVLGGTRSCDCRAYPSDGTFAFARKQGSWGYQGTRVGIPDKHTSPLVRPLLGSGTVGVREMAARSWAEAVGRPSSPA